MVCKQCNPGVLFTANNLLQPTMLVHFTCRESSVGFFFCFDPLFKKLEDVILPLLSWFCFSVNPFSDIDAIELWLNEFHIVWVFWSTETKLSSDCDAFCKQIEAFEEQNIKT